MVVYMYSIASASLNELGYVLSKTKRVRRILVSGAIRINKTTSFEKNRHSENNIWYNTVLYAFFMNTFDKNARF